MSVDALADHPNQVDKSPYAYAWNNPISLTDPDGNCPNCPNPIMTRANEQLANGEISPQELFNTALSVLAVDATAASVFLPGPEDVVGAAVAATAVGSKVIGVLSKFGGKIVEGAKSLFKGGDEAINLGKATKADYVTTPDGTTTSTDLNKVQTGYEKAGFDKVQTSSSNIMYEVPKANGSGTFYSRMQEGKNPRTSNLDGDRIINTQNTGNPRNKQYVNPDGSPIKGASASERKRIGHIHLTPKTN